MASDTDETDRALIERAPRDPAAFGALFERHFDTVFGYIVRRTRDWDAARDLTSEVFLKALRNAWRYKWKGVPVSAWLFAIANNELRMYFRRGARVPALGGPRHRVDVHAIVDAGIARLGRLGELLEHGSPEERKLLVQAFLARLEISPQDGKGRPISLNSRSGWENFVFCDGGGGGI